MFGRRTVTVILSLVSTFSTRIILSLLLTTTSMETMTSSMAWLKALLLLSLSHGGTGFVVHPSPIHCQGGRFHGTTGSSFLSAASPRLPRDEVPQQQPQQQPPGASSVSEGPLTFRDSVRDFFLSLTRLSLQDYEWRSSYFKSTEADRMLEESLARMQGVRRPYVRPMDASEDRIGPLGRWEKSSVEWLESVIDEEGRRAKKIVSNRGKLIRPIETAEGDAPLGPLGFLEQRASEFLNKIRQSEQERVRTKTLQPKDLPEEIRGPLGALELTVSRFLRDMKESEKLRAEQSKRRGGAMVRPIDVPGPLGEWEMRVADILRAEERRAQLKKREGRVVRPKDAVYKGPLGEAEQAIYDLFDQLRAEEYLRLQNIQQLMKDRRPMETDRMSVLGVAESIMVGIVRAPQLFMSVLQRVGELLTSEPLSEDDKERLRDTSTLNKDPPSKN